MDSANALVWVLSLVNLLIMGMARLFTYESVREQEIRASKIGGAAAVFHLIFPSLEAFQSPSHVFPLLLDF